MSVDSAFDFFLDDHRRFRHLLHPPRLLPHPPLALVQHPRRQGREVASLQPLESRQGLGAQHRQQLWYCHQPASLIRP